MKKIFILPILLFSQSFAFALTNPDQINKNILGCQDDGSQAYNCKMPTTPISAGYNYEMEFDLTYSFACYGSPMTLGFGTEPNHATYGTPFTSNPASTDPAQSQDKPTLIRAYGTSVSLTDLDPELTSQRTYFSPCTFVVDNFSVDFSPATKNTLELYLKTMQQINELIPLAKTLTNQVNMLKVLYASLDIPHLQSALSNLKSTISDTMAAVSDDTTTTQSLQFISNEIDLEVSTSPALNPDGEKQLRDKISSTFDEINTASVGILNHVAQDSADYYVKAEDILLTLKNDPYAISGTFDKYQSRFDTEHQKSLSIN